MRNSGSVLYKTLIYGIDHSYNKYNCSTGDRCLKIDPVGDEHDPVVRAEMVAVLAVLAVVYVFIVIVTTKITDLDEGGDSCRW